MSHDIRKVFLTNYLSGLFERTRREKDGTKWGIDWVVYNLGLALFEKPVRLPFIRQAGGGTERSKSEAEFGVDEAFLSSQGKELIVFALKDEALTYKNWLKHDFLADLQRASAPDLSAQGLNDVKAVRVILVYNKDEDRNGVEQYDRFVSNQPSRLKDTVQLSYERWNLSELVDRCAKHLLNAAVLPHEFFGQLNYLSALFARVEHGTDPWVSQLIPAWARFVDDVLAQERGDRAGSILPVALIILKEHGESNKTIQTGWIELVEIAALALWRESVKTGTRHSQLAVLTFWEGLYIEELYRFYIEHIDALSTEGAIDQLANPGYVGAVAAGAVAYWHLGRLGLLAYALTELRTSEPDDVHTQRRPTLMNLVDCIVRILNGNQSGYRPLLDIHHIEWFLVTFALLRTGRVQEIEHLLNRLCERLHIRRRDHSELPFLDGANSLEHVFEHVATMGQDSEVSTGTSSFALMLLELSFALPQPDRDRLLMNIYFGIVAELSADGSQGYRALHLSSWIPPADWHVKVLNGPVRDGEEVTLAPFADLKGEVTPDVIALRIKQLVEQVRHLGSFPDRQPVPMAALILACIRHQSPLPPELWRRSIFPVAPTAT